MNKAYFVVDRGGVAMKTGFKKRKKEHRRGPKNKQKKTQESWVTFIKQLISCNVASFLFCIV